MTRSPPQPNARRLAERLQAEPRLGLGCAGLGNLYSAVSDEEALITLEYAWSRGVRYFDTAPYYGGGLSEIRLGRFLEQNHHGDAIVSSKVGRSLRALSSSASNNSDFIDAEPFEAYFDYTRDGVLRQVDESLGRLKRDHLDIAFVHDLGRVTHWDDHEDRFREALDGAFPALIELQSQGVVGSIGIGVNEVPVCIETLHQVNLDFILIAGRYSLLDQSAADTLFPVCESHGVGVIVGGPFNSGILAGGDNYDYAPATVDIQNKVRRLRSVCGEFNVALQAAALQFVLRAPEVLCTIPGSRSIGEIESNFNSLNVKIPNDLWAALNE